MRKSLWTLTLLVAVAVPAGSAAKPRAARGRPEPISCPADVGVALAEQCPCDGGVQPWKNKGQYQRCVVHSRNALRKAGCLDAAQKQTIARCAARSTCGRPGAVLCCRYVAGACSDPQPGDLVAAGTCSTDATVACDSDAECIVGTAKVAHDEDACAAGGGTAVGGGSVCGGCPAPPAAPAE